MMSRGVIASPQSHTLFSSPCNPLIIQSSSPFFPSSVKPLSSAFIKFPTISFRCNSSADSGDNESKTILDAFFLGKAVGEVLNERIESTVGEFLSIIGRLQAEQRKQISEFQEVLEKARRAKEEASKEALSNSTALDTSTAGGVSESTPSVSNSVIPAASNEDPL